MTRMITAIGRFLYDAIAALGAAWVGEEDGGTEFGCRLITEKEKKTTNQ